jgi:hypothetical protein
MALNDFHAEHGCCLAKVFHLEFGEEGVLGIQEKGWTGSNCAVVDVDGGDGDAASVMKNVDAGVALEQFESPGVKLGIDHAVPLVWCLFEAIEGLVKFTDMIGSGQINIAFGLVDVDLLGEVCVERLTWSGS